VIKKIVPYLLAALVFVFVLVLLRPSPQQQVVTAAIDLPAGHRIVESDLVMRPLESDRLPEDVISDPQLIIGQTLRQERTAGDLVLTRHIGAEAVMLQPNERAIAITVSDSAGLAGLLRAGDLVGVNAVVFADSIGNSGAFSKATIEGLRVLYLSPSFAAEDPAEMAGSIVTPDPATGLAVQRERVKEGTVLLAVPTSLQAIAYDFTMTDPNIPDQVRQVSAIELLSALDVADNASLSLYLMPEGAEAFSTTGLYLPELVITPGYTPTATQSPTPNPYATPTVPATPTVMP